MATVRNLRGNFLLISYCLQACTGSGKTLAFVIPIMEMLQKRSVALMRHEVGAVVIAPTRELAQQLFSVISKFTANPALKHPLRPILLTGGSGAMDDIRRCVSDGCNIVVATPGRLMAVMEQTGPEVAAAVAGTDAITVQWRTCEVLVLDEADTLLAMGFEDELTHVLAGLPKQRRTGLFSATQTTEVKALARAGMRNPAVIKVAVQSSAARAAAAAADQSGTPHAAAGANGAAAAAAASTTAARTPTALHNFYILTREESKLSALVHLLQQRRAAPGGNDEKWIVFCMTGAAVDFLTPLLQRLLLGESGAAKDAEGHTTIKPFVQPLGMGELCRRSQVWGLHGKMATKKRSGVYNDFVASTGGVLVCTDVAARGLDVPDVDWCVQYDPPSDPDFFVHRVGRTARAGRAGIALVMLLPQETDYVDLLAMHGVPTRHTSLEHMVGYSVDAPAPLPQLAARPNKEAEDKAAADAAAGVVRLHDTVTDVTHATMTLCLADRDLLERGTKAFVAFVRGYQEHKCRYIFRFARLRLGRLARCMGLVRFPHLKDLRGSTKVNYSDPQEVLGTSVDTSSIAYLDPKREAARLARRQAELAAAAAADMEAGLAKKAKKDASKSAAASAAAAAGGGAQQKRGVKRKRTGQQEKMFDEWEDLASEARLVRRLKSGKISQAQFDLAVHGAADPELLKSRSAVHGEAPVLGEGESVPTLESAAEGDKAARLADFVRRSRKAKRAVVSRTARKGMLYGGRGPQAKGKQNRAGLSKKK